MALAGANQRQATGLDEEDGILTAEEIAALDLSGVEWAVLSACDTGIGEVKAGEGVLGLRRAFQVAGARTLIMSLWPVEDQVARDWMRQLYRARLVLGLTTIDGVHQANLKTLRQRRAKGQSLRIKTERSAIRARIYLRSSASNNRIPCPLVKLLDKLDQSPLVEQPAIAMYVSKRTENSGTGRLDFNILVPNQGPNRPKLLSWRHLLVFGPLSDRQVWTSSRAEWLVSRICSRL